MTDRQIREKLVIRGVGAMSDAELLALLIGSSDASSESIGMADCILADKPLEDLAALSLRDMRMTGGMGIRRAVSLAVAFELGRRVREREASAKDEIRTSDDVVSIFQPLLAHLDYEEFWVAYLNSAHRIIQKVRISQGGVSGTVVDHKIIVKRAVELLSSAIVVVHNHPSGVSKPSDEDIALTGKLVTASSLFDIQVLDHVIVSTSASFSFRASGLIE